MELLQPSDIGLILTYKCQCACAHCLYNCSPTWKDWMTPDEVEAALQAMQFWGDTFQVHITGGEPFLNFPLLMHAVQTATRLGIPRYLETNAGWGVKEDLVAERFSALRQAGLLALLISCSPFHAEHIPPQRTMLAIRKGVEIFGFERTMVYLSEWLARLRSFGDETTTPLSSYVETYGAEEAGRLFWSGYGLISGGRSAYRLGQLTRSYPAESFRSDNCRREMLHAPHSHFDLYGNFIPGFCGGVSLGNWHDLPGLLNDLHHQRYPELIGILIQAGPFGLFELAKQVYEYNPLAEGYVGKCHLCVDVRRHLVSRATFSELNPIEFYKRF